MKRNIFYVIISIIIMALLIIISLLCFLNPKKTLTEASNLKSEKITKIVFNDGRGGLNKPLTLEDKQKIAEFIGYLDKCIVKKDANQSDIRIGWIHSATFYNNNKEISDITFNDPVQINLNNYYTIIKNELSTEKVDKFLQSIDPTYKTQ